MLSYPQIQGEMGSSVEETQGRGRSAELLRASLELLPPSSVWVSATHSCSPRAPGDQPFTQVVLGCLLSALGLMVKVGDQVVRPHASQTWVGVRGEGALFGQQ